MSVGREIRRARGDRGMRLREVARKAGISPSSLARIEADQVSPNLTTVEQVARALDIDAAALLGFVDASDRARNDASRGGVQQLSSEAHRLVAAFSRMGQTRRRLLLGIAEELATGEKPARTIGRTEKKRPGESESPKRSPRHYVQGWAPSTARRELESDLVLGHTAGEQFSKPFEPMEEGDVLWIVFVEEGKLHLIGRMQVAGRGSFLPSDRSPEDPIFSQREAERFLGRDDVWESREHLIAREGTAQALEDIEVETQLVRQLEFQTGSGISRVAVERGRVAGQAFRSIRLLTPSSAQEFERLWKRHAQRRRRT